MVALNTPVCEFDKKAPDFKLPDCFGNTHTLKDCLGPNGLLVMFICNHCPFVKAILPDLIKTTEELRASGINTVAIMSNDFVEYPDDSPENMKALVEEKNFGFPYLVDETQTVAKEFGAVCTPDFFGYNSDLGLQYRGRFDGRGRNIDSSAEKNELLEAMLKVAKTGKGPKEQIPSIGCSIKWKE